MTISSFDAQVVRLELSSEEDIANILAHGPQIKKCKDTLISQTLKIEEKKVSFFYLWARSRDMAISSFKGQEVKYVPSSRGVNANILAPGTWIKKHRTLCFLTL